MKKKISIFVTTLFLAFYANSQNITNTLGSSGEFLVEDNSNAKLIIAKTAFGYPAFIIGDPGSLSISRPFTMVQEANSSVIDLITFRDGGFGSLRSQIHFSTSRGNITSPAVVEFNDNIGELVFEARAGSAFAQSAGITVTTGESPQDGSTGAVATAKAPSYITFTTTNSSGSLNDVFHINGDGTIQIPGLTSVTDLQTNANGILINGASDARLKTNVKNLPYGLSELLKLRPVTFNWTEDSEMGEGLKHGFIAQEVAEVLPELVRTRHDGYHTLSYKELVPLLTSSIQEQQKQISELEKRLDKIENSQIQTASMPFTAYLVIGLLFILSLVFYNFKKSPSK